LLSCLRDSHLTVRIAAARLLCENVHTEPEVIAALRLLLIEAANLQAEAAGLVKRTSSSTSSVQLRFPQPSGWYDAALVAAEALGKIGPSARESIPVLLEASEQKNDLRLRIEAALAIREINGDAQRLSSALADAFASDDLRVHKLALKKLYALTPSWPEAQNF